MTQWTKILALILVVLAGSFAVWAQESDDELNDLLADYVTADDPGVVLYISVADVAWIATAGLADIESGDAIAPDDLFRIASASKPFIATLVLQLVEAGEINLDAPIADYIPADVAANVVNAQTATVRQVLQMTSGIADYTESDAYDDAIQADPSHWWTPEAVLTFIYEEDPYFVPGEDYYYSNSNFILAQLLIEGITGESLADALRENIFDPAGMDACYLETEDTFAQGIVRGYEDDGEWIDITEINDGVGLGDGGIICSASDLAKFLPALMNGEWIGEDTLAEMLDTVDDGEGGNYGLGIGYDDSEYGMLVSHDGASSGFQSVMAYLPDEDVVVVILTNNFDSDIMEDLQYDAFDWALSE